jgi:hypothetical protein
MAATALKSPGQPRRWHDGWKVPSSRGYGAYYVECSTDGRWRCTCPAFVFRGERLGGNVLGCKHIRLVR